MHHAFTLCFSVRGQEDFHREVEWPVVPEKGDYISFDDLEGESFEVYLTEFRDTDDGLLVIVCLTRLLGPLRTWPWWRRTLYSVGKLLAVPGCE